MQRYGIVLAAAVIVAAVGSASAQGLLSAIGTGFWQGAWGTEGMTPVVTVSGQAVTYEGANKQTFPESHVGRPSPLACGPTPDLRPTARQRIARTQMSDFDH